MFISVFGSFASSFRASGHHWLIARELRFHPPQQIVEVSHSLGFVLHWLGDSLDGTLARYRNIQKPRYGFYLDHVVDALGELLIALGLGLSPYFRFDVALHMLAGYLLMTLQNYLLTCATNIFVMSQAKIGGTEIRLLAILLNAVVFFAGYPVIQLPFGAVSAYDLFGITFAGILLIAFVASTSTRSVRLAEMDN